MTSQSSKVNVREATTCGILLPTRPDINLQGIACHQAELMRTVVQPRATQQHEWKEPGYCLTVAMYGALAFRPLECALEGVKRLLREAIHEAQLVRYALAVELINPPLDAPHVIGAVDEALLFPMNGLNAELENDVSGAR